MDQPKRRRGRKKPETPRGQSEAAPKDFLEIGGSPVSGLTLRRILRGHKKGIAQIAWSPDARQLASPSDDGTLRVWDVGTGDCRKLFEIPVKRHSLEQHICAIWSPDGGMLATSFDNIIQLRNGINGELIRTFLGHEEWVNDMDFSPNGGMLASTSKDRTIRIWDTMTGEEKRILGKFQEVTSSINWSEDGLEVSAGIYDRTLRVWNTLSWELCVTLKLSQRDLHSIAFHKQIAAIALDG